MKIKSRFICFISLILAITLVCGLAACGEPANNYKLNKTSISIDVGATETLTVSDGANNVTATWASANEQIATVLDGVVTGVSAGTTNVTATVDGKTLTCSVTVNEVVGPTYTISSASKTLKKGGSFTLTVSDGGQLVSDVVWVAGNTNATVDSNGLVTGVAVGVVTIYGQIGNDLVTCEVRVVEYSISNTELVLDVEEQFTLTVSDGMGIVSAESWSVEGTAVSVSNGIVLANSVGVATVKANIDGVELTCSVMVKEYTISEATKQLTLFDDFTLTVTDGIQNLTAEWSVQGDAVTVLNGKVEAVRVGTATVIAVAEGKTLTCNVTVVAPSVVPTLSLAVSDNTTIISTGESFTITPTFTYGGEAEEFSEITYKASSSNVSISTQGNVATVSAVGYADEVVITATIDWYGVSITNTVSVKVIKVELSFSTTSISLSADASGGAVSSALVATLKVNGKATTQGLNIVSNDNNVATYNNGIVTAVKAGNTNVVASYTSESGKTFTVTCAVTVALANFDKTDIPAVTIYKAVEDGVNSINFDDYDINAATDGYIVYDITDENPVLINSTRNGNVYTLDRADLIGGTERTLQIVKDGKISVSFKVVVISKILKDAEDIENLISYGYKTIVGEAGMNVYDYAGYYILNNNIDMTGKTINANILNGDIASDEYSYNGKVGFSGTFDGQGYIIYGGSYGKNGLFGLTKNGSVIKNVAFVGHTLGFEGHTLGLTVGSIVDNVLVDVAIAGDESDGLAEYISGAELKNVVSYFPKNTTHAYALSNYLFDADFSGCGNLITNVQNVYAFGGTRNLDGNMYGYSHGYYMSGQHSNIVWSTIDTANGNLGDNSDKSFEGLDSAIWDLSGNRASFKNLISVTPATPYTYVQYTDVTSSGAIANTQNLTIEIGDVTYTATAERLRASETGDVKILFDYNGAWVNVPVTIYTAEIKDADDIVYLEKYVTKESITDVGTGLFNYDGYFVVKNNIDMSGRTVQFQFGSGGQSGEYGFQGTFDGQGYTIYGGTYLTGGIFASLGKNSEVKNVAFVDAQVGTTTDPGYILGAFVGGKVTNVLVDANVVANVWQTYGLSGWIAGGDLTNVVVYLNNVNSVTYTDGIVTYGNYVGRPGGDIKSYKTSTMTNCYSIGGQTTADYLGYSHSYQIAEGLDIHQFDEGTNIETINFTGFDSDMWNFSGEHARFNSYRDVPVENQVIYAKYTGLDANNNYERKANTEDLVITWNGGSITVSAEELSTLGMGKVNIINKDSDTQWYSISVLICTAEIKNADDIVYLEKYVDKEIVDDSTGLFNYNGYFVVKNNIDMTGRTVQFQFSGSTRGEHGFQGTFDGQGYTIYGGTYLKGGIFASLGQNSVIKDVAFVDVQVGTTTDPGYLLGVKIGGVVSNVLVDANAVANIWQTYGLAEMISGGNLTNVVVYLNNVNSVTFTDGIETFANYVGGPGGDINAYKVSTMANCYSIGGQVGGSYLGYSHNYQIVSGLDIQQFNEGTDIETINFTGFDSDMWNFDGEHARFNSYLEA